MWWQKLGDGSCKEKVGHDWAEENKKTEKGISREKKPHQHKPLEVLAEWDSVATSCSHGSLAIGLLDRFGGMKERGRDRKFEKLRGEGE